MIISNLTNQKGNKVENQFLIRDGEKKVFQSYNSKIAEYDIETRELKIFEDWDYSKTTMKYFKQFIENETCYNYGTKANFEKTYKSHDKVKFII